MFPFPEPLVLTALQGLDMALSHTSVLTVVSSVFRPILFCVLKLAFLEATTPRNRAWIAIVSRGLSMCCRFGGRRAGPLRKIWGFGKTAVNSLKKVGEVSRRRRVPVVEVCDTTALSQAVPALPLETSSLPQAVSPVPIETSSLPQAVPPVPIETTSLYIEVGVQGKAYTTLSLNLQYVAIIGGLLIVCYLTLKLIRVLRNRAEGK